MKQFVCKPTIHMFPTCKDFLAGFDIGEDDLVLSNAYIFKPFFDGLDCRAKALFLEDYGQGEPSDTMVDALLAAASRYDFRRIIAIGGGSVIDVAKVLAVAPAGSDTSAVFDCKELKQEKELIILPTTCGTGSEVTNISIINRTCLGIKVGLVHDSLYARHAVLVPELLPLDRYALHAAAQVHDRVQDAYMTYDFHKVYHTLHNYCVTDLSAVYLDILKDRLYSSAPASKERRSAQTALYHLLCMLVRDMAPVLSFTAEEIFHHLPNDLRDDVPTVFALPPVDSKPYLLEDGVRDDWNVLLAVRGAVTRAIEPLRRDSVVGHSLDTSVTLYVADELRERLEGLHTDLRAFFIVSQLHLAPLAEAPADAVQDAEVAGLAVGVAKAAGEKCERCWIYSTELGSDPAHPTLCPRCAKVMAELPEA